jgi:ADP-heptose:LPS heptosyltransferase
MRIWGVSYGLIGDLVMGLPCLTYFEKKYPESYKLWVIEKKCSQAAELFLNHPLIDRIKITDEWSGFGSEDFKLHDACDIRAPLAQSHQNPHWYNETNCVEETAAMAGVTDLKESLSKDEMYPELVKWFPVGFRSTINTGYSDKFDNSHNGIFQKSIAIWPFAGYGSKDNRSPSFEWWQQLVNALIDAGLLVFHFGYMNEPVLDRAARYVDLSFADQIKCSLASDLSITTDSGSGWVLGAYSHPSIALSTFWMPGHRTNPEALRPVNRNGDFLFEEGGCDNISIDKVMQIVQRRLDTCQKD